MSDQPRSDDLDVFLEALLFIAERPLTAAELGDVAGVPRPHADAALAGLAERLEEDRRGLRLQRQDDAYRQPCTRGDVERVRGVDSDYVIRSLLHRRLIMEVGRRDTPGRPILFGTTFTFLERFGLTSLDDLPPLSGDAAQLTAAPSLPDPVDEPPGADGA